MKRDKTIEDFPQYIEGHLEAWFKTLAVLLVEWIKKEKLKDK